MTLEQPCEEPLCGAPITTWLDEDVDHIAVLVDGTPEKLPLAPDGDEELVQVPGIAQPPPEPEGDAGEVSIRAQWAEMHAAKAPQLEAFNEAKFGMFIHWGLYATPAGEWKGERMPGISEWIMKRAEIPRDEYAALAETLFIGSSIPRARPLGGVTGALGGWLPSD